MIEPSGEHARPPAGPRPPAPPATGGPDHTPDPRDAGHPIQVHLGGVRLGDLGHPVVDALLLNAILLRRSAASRWLEEHDVQSADVEAAFPQRSGRRPTSYDSPETRERRACFARTGAAPR